MALAWGALNEPLTASNLIVGFVLGYAVLYLAQPVIGPSRYFTKVRQVIGLVLFFLWELILANLRVAMDVITPHYDMTPAVIAIPLDAQSDAEITLLANMITLTPGTLSLDVSSDRKTLYIHALYAKDCDAVRRNIKNGFEKRLLEVLR
ncbi:MAG TPA: Na+/H+ antiporter subunit E [Terriglobia bacterium]|nr:Na+/H+ antiporter subunit E [Terriglobia bacterium]